jgi:excinuclease ABC subunit A
LGPEGGARGGEVIRSGTPEEIAADFRSYTGQALQSVLPNKPSERRVRTTP